MVNHILMGVGGLDFSSVFREPTATNEGASGLEGLGALPEFPAHRLIYETRYANGNVVRLWDPSRSSPTPITNSATRLAFLSPSSSFSEEPSITMAAANPAALVLAVLALRGLGSAAGSVAERMGWRHVEGLRGLGSSLTEHSVTLAECDAMIAGMGRDLISLNAEIRSTEATIPALGSRLEEIRRTQPATSMESRGAEGLLIDARARISSLTRVRDLIEARRNILDALMNGRELDEALLNRMMQIGVEASATLGETVTSDGVSRFRLHGTDHRLSYSNDGSRATGQVDLLTAIIESLRGEVLRREQFMRGNQLGRELTLRAARDQLAFAEQELLRRERVMMEGDAQASRNMDYLRNNAEREHNFLVGEVQSREAELASAETVLRSSTGETRSRALHSSPEIRVMRESVVTANNALRTAEGRLRNFDAWRSQVMQVENLRRRLEALENSPSIVELERLRLEFEIMTTLRDQLRTQPSAGASVTAATVS